MPMVNIDGRYCIITSEFSIDTLPFHSVWQLHWRKLTAKECCVATQHTADRYVFAIKSLQTSLLQGKTIHE